ncbi:OmpA family protein [Microvirga sp. STR05]|uniref:OmpA family protein n=1 Tax=Hymenobacter duratus TaxID=2771356 RepID=A0ABR8JBX6_9BACT|nr:OmpA family protein [Hymenobacter duratus]MBD2714259.1 OmpA family protein [Hymenobacter duratus]MBR7949162.1 OmpA family protein [Microvirga sp. STR05]
MSRALRVAGPLLLALLATGCSDQQSATTATGQPDAGQPLTGTANAPVGSSPPTTATEATPASASRPDQGQKLTGQVSDLSGAASDLGGKMTDMGLVINFDTDVLFDFDKADIKPGATPTLEKLAEVVKQYTKSRVVINGYTDAKGDDTYNRTLSQRRAQAIADWLTQHQAGTAGQLQVQGFGEANPVAPNTNPDGSDNPAGRQQNRRVEVIIS